MSGSQPGIPQCRLRMVPEVCFPHLPGHRSGRSSLGRSVATALCEGMSEPACTPRWAQAWDCGQVTPVLPKRQPRAIPVACLLTKHDGNAWGLMTVSRCGRLWNVGSCLHGTTAVLLGLFVAASRIGSFLSARSRAEPVLCRSDPELRTGFLRTGECPLLLTGPRT